MPRRSASGPSTTPSPPCSAPLLVVLLFSRDEGGDFRGVPITQGRIIAGVRCPANPTLIVLLPRSHTSVVVVVVRGVGNATVGVVAPPRGVGPYTILLVVVQFWFVVRNSIGRYLYTLG